METQLHILTRIQDSLAAQILEELQSQDNERIKIFNLTGSHPDYQALLEAVFNSDQVAVW